MSSIKRQVKRIASLKLDFFRFIRSVIFKICCKREKKGETVRVVQSPFLAVARQMLLDLVRLQVVRNQPLRHANHNSKKQPC